MMRTDARIQRAIAKMFCDQPWLSSRQLAQAAGCSPSTAHKLRLIIEAARLQPEELLQLNDAALAVRLFGPAKVPARQSAAPDWTDVHRQLQQPDATLIEIWHDWKEAHPAGWSYSYFAKQYRCWLKKQDVTLRRVHRAGEKTFVDFAGGTLTIHLDDNSMREAQLFVAVLGASNYTFCRFVGSQTIADWIDCHNQMVRYFCGCTQFIVPDNLKAAVTREGLKHLVLNPTYRAWAEHHGAIVLPAKARKPRYKAKVEVGVQIVQRVILWRMRRQRWYSLEEANAALMQWLERFNARPFRKLPGCRKERFEQLDRPMLGSLPSYPFEYFELVVGKRIPSDYHVEYQEHFYSVPYVYVGQKIDLRITAGAIEMLLDGRRVAAHVRSYEKGEKTTLSEHMPEAHRHAQNGEPAELRAWAERMGPATQTMVEQWLAPGSGFYRGLTAARGLRAEADFLDAARIESVCAYAQRVQSRTLNQLRSILRFNLDRRAEMAPAQLAGSGLHENIRGAAYFVQKKERVMMTQQTLTQLRALKLHGMAQAYDLQISQPSSTGLPFDDRFGLLVEAECSARETRKLKRLISRAKLPEFPLIEDLDGRTERKLDSALIRTLTGGDWVQRQQNILVTGPTGTGKTWLACALAGHMCRLGRSVRYLLASELYVVLKQSAADGTWLKLKRQLIQMQVLMIDDFGLAPMPSDIAYMFLEIIDKRSRTGSLIVISQFGVDQWHGFFPDPTLADAVLDRIVHRAHQITLEGESMRKLRAREEMRNTPKAKR